MKSLLGCVAGTAAGCAALLLTSAPVRADDNSYMQYLNSHGYTAKYADGQPISVSSAEILGHMICDNLQVGRPIARQAPNYPMWPQFGLMSEAAQHEICPGE